MHTRKLQSDFSKAPPLLQTNRFPIAVPRAVAQFGDSAAARLEASGSLPGAARSIL